MHLTKKNGTKETRSKSRAKIVAVIMAGGSGTRFWPLSDGERPKQFLKLFGDKTMLQETYDRLKGLVPPGNIMVLTNRRYVSIVREQLPEVPHENIVGEPLSRDTAAAVTLAAVLCRTRFGNPIMLILPADHYIRPVKAFHDTIYSAVRAVYASGTFGQALYTFGVTPTYAATGYGYLLCDEKVKDDKGIEHYRIKQFKEKPNPARALSYLQAGNVYWNSGIFLWRTDAILERVTKHLPQHVERLAEISKYDGSGAWEKALHDALQPLPKVSIDIGVMEKTDCVYMVRALFEWSDIGTWAALDRYLQTDESGNTVRGNLKSLDAANNLVFSEDEREVVALIGVQNLVVVRCQGKTLIVDRNRTEDVKRIVENMKPPGDHARRPCKVSF